MLGGILSAIAGPIANKIFGGSGGDQPNTGGVQSTLNSASPPPMQQNVTGGSLFQDALKHGLQSGINMGLSKMGLSPGQQAGAENRRFLDESFPELNPWEKAGSSAAGTGGQVGTQEKVAKLQTETQDKMNRRSVAAQERMNKVAAEAGIQSAGISAAPNMALVSANRDALAESAHLRFAQTAGTYQDTAFKRYQSLPNIMAAHDRGDLTTAQAMKAIGALGVQGIGSTLFGRRPRQGGRPAQTPTGKPKAGPPKKKDTGPQLIY